MDESSIGRDNERYVSTSKPAEQRLFLAVEISHFQMSRPSGQDMCNLGSRKPISSSLEELDRGAKTPWSVLYERLSKHGNVHGSWIMLQHVFAFGCLSIEFPSVSPLTPNWASARHSAS